MEPIWMNGKDMIKFEESQGDYCYFDKSMNVVKINPDWQYLVGLDDMEKNSIVFDIRKINFRSVEKMESLTEKNNMKLYDTEIIINGRKLSALEATVVMEALKDSADNGVSNDYTQYELEISKDKQTKVLEQFA